MPGLLTDVDPDGLLEYSVVFTDRSLNHMSQAFQGIMNDISATLKKVYNAERVVVVPGGGTYGMESVARQFATGRKCLVVRNGFFSFRWSQILEMGSIDSETIVMKARTLGNGPQAPFAPHVETSSGMLLPDEYIRAAADAVHSVGGLLVLDCIASGELWIDMQACGVDILISAPQKGWSASPCSALVMLGRAAAERISNTNSTSFACDLRKWLEIMTAYENGGHAYHATMPTDALKKFRDTMKETETAGFENVRREQLELGRKVREILEDRGFRNVAAAGFQAPGVVVSYTDDAEIQNGKKFLEQGLQIAAGVPLMCDEPEGFRTFRLGLFGLDKLNNIDRTVASLSDTLDRM